MHRLGYAHSIECWQNTQLIGGLYGLQIGSCFFGESMFSKSTNTSKFCLLFLISILIKKNFLLLDSQFYNSHLLQFGAYEILDEKYQGLLNFAICKKNNFLNNMNYSESLLILQSLTQRS